MRLRLRQSEYDFNVVHYASLTHQAADTLSCLLATGEVQTHLDDDSPVLAKDKQDNGEQTLHTISTDGGEKNPL